MEQTIRPIQVFRGKHLESSHLIHVAVVNREGNLIYSYGDPLRSSFARSSMKPLQAIPLVESGAADFFSYTPAELALSCASHSGEDFHRSAVTGILDRIGQNEKGLQCGTHMPRDINSFKELLRSGKDLTPVFSNCSGKHSGMLASCVFLNEDTTTYRDIDHPHQQRILDVIANVCDYDKNSIGIGIDGCGVPVHQLPLNKLAVGFACLAQPNNSTDLKHTKALTIIRDAMMAHPEMVGGTDRFDTDLMKVFNGRIVAKAGAEGVQCLGDVDTGMGIAIKVEDGNGRATSVATMAVLKKLGIGDETHYSALQKHAELEVKNIPGEVIGRIIADFELEKAAMPS